MGGIRDREWAPGLPKPQASGLLKKLKGKRPDTVVVDPEADAQRIAAEAAVAANNEAANRRRSRRLSALSASRPGTAGAEGSALSYGKTVLGG